MLVIFDRSAFHGERFNLLLSSPLKYLCNRKILKVAHTQIFLEETIRMYGKAEKRDQLKQQLPFILDICNEGFFHDKEEIWTDELIHGHGLYANLYWVHVDQQHVVETLKANILSSEEWPDWHSSIWDDMEGKKNRQREIYREVRTEVPERIKEKGHKISLSNLSFNEYQNSELDFYGRHLIQTHIKSKNNEVLQMKWSENKNNYPFVTAFTKGLVYAGYYAAIEQNKALDRNAQADYEQLMYMVHADVLVSSDEGFLRSAFLELWEPQGKKLFTPEKFVELLRDF